MPKFVIQQAIPENSDSSQLTSTTKPNTGATLTEEPSHSRRNSTISTFAGNS